MNNHNVITKTNDLVSKSAYNISHLEQLIFLSALSEINSKEKVTDNQRYRLDLSSLSKSANIQGNDKYSHFKRAVGRLYTRRISIPQEDGSTLVTGFIQAYKYHDGEGCLSIRFSSEIMPYISSIRKSFVSYKFKQVAKFKSAYSARIYELLIQRLDLSNKREIPLSDIRYMFQLGTTYERYNNIKQRVIEPSINDINTYSDINVIYNEIRIGRKVTALEFHIEALEPRPITKKQIEQEALPGESYDEAKERLKEEKEPKKTPFWKKLFK